MKKILTFLGRAGVVSGVGTVLLVEGWAGQLDFRTDINPALIYFQAYQEMPQLSEEETKHLFDSWPGGVSAERPVGQRAIGLLKQYDNCFKLMSRARFSRIPCDWGYDLTLGPEALLPGLAPAKRLAQAARLRAAISLDAKEFDSWREDFAAAFVLGRNLSRDGVLISDLVQIAIESILTSAIMEQYYRLSPDQLDQLVAVIDSAPRRGTIAETIPSEDHAFYRYFLRKVEAMIAESKGNNEQFWARFESFWNPIATDADSGQGPDPSARLIKEAGESNPAAVIRLLNEMPALYAETARIMALPYVEFKEQSPVLWTRIDEAKNPFIRRMFPVFKNVRGKEFSAIVRQEMVRAAAAYKRGGMTALRAVPDPLVGGAFEFSPVQFEGVDRGFRLKSRERFRDFDEVMIFLETPGKPFRLDGKNAGTAR